MPDLDFPDLVNPAADAASPPPFDTLRERADRRQKRRAAATALAVVVAVVAVASGIAVTTGHRTGSLPPALPTPSPTATVSAGHVTWRDLDDQQRLAWVLRNGNATDFAVDDAGNTLVLWIAFQDGVGQHSAWELMAEPSGQHHAGLLPGWASTVTSTPAGFLISVSEPPSHPHPSFMPVLVRADGSISAVTQVAGPGNGSLAGDLEMNTQQGIAVVDPATATWWPVGGLGRDAAAGAVVNGQVLVWRFSGDYDAGTYHGALVPICPPGRSCPAFYDKPVVTFPGSTMSGLVVSSGDKVAAFSSMDGATIWPVHSWAVSDDGGTTFHVYSPDTVPFDEVASMASTSTGILLVANSSGQVWSSTDWVHFTKLELGASPVPPKAQLADLKPGLHGDVLAQILTKDEQQQPTIVMLDKQTLRGAEWVGPDGWRDVNAG